MPYLDRNPAPPSDPRSLQAYVHAYIEHLTARHYARQSVQYKRASLIWFLDWCRERGIERIHEITRPVLQRYQQHLYHALGRNGKPLSVQSQCNRLTAIRTWFKFLMRENLILYNPASELELPKREKRLPKHTLTAEEAEKIMSQPDVSTPAGLRDRAMLEVLYSTGIRRAELLNLELADINHAAGILAIRQGKGRKDRFVPIGERALAWIDKYLDDGRAVPATETGPVFVDETGRPLDPHRVSRAVKKYIGQAGVEKEGRCHLFRHTMATLMLENGADLRYIQQILGHAHLSTTEIYTHVAIHKLKQIHSATHPATLPEGVSDRLKAARGEAPDPTADDILAALDQEAMEEGKEER
jgi:integrase/recombinase XerD